MDTSQKISFDPKVSEPASSRASTAIERLVLEPARGGMVGTEGIHITELIKTETIQGILWTTINSFRNSGLDSSDRPATLQTS